MSFRDSMGLLEVEYINTKGFESLNSMFRNCKKLKDISGIYNWNISKVTNMDHLFGSCLSLKEIDLSKWKTDNINEISFMFDCCRNLTKIDVSNISLSKTNTKSSIYVEKVFNQCENLSDLKIFDFNNDCFSFCNYNSNQHCKSNYQRYNPTAFTIQKTNFCKCNNCKRNTAKQ